MTLHENCEITKCDIIIMKCAILVLALFKYIKQKLLRVYEVKNK